MINIITTVLTMLILASIYLLIHFLSKNEERRKFWLDPDINEEYKTSNMLYKRNAYQYEVHQYGSWVEHREPCLLIILLIVASEIFISLFMIVSFICVFIF